MIWVPGMKKGKREKSAILSMSLLYVVDMASLVGSKVRVSIEIQRNGDKLGGKAEAGSLN